MESCASCRFAVPSVNAKWEGPQCHRRQPVQTQPRIGAEWPNVHPDWWCGEYEAKVDAPAKKAPRPAAGSRETAA